jgi:hypothetical protein
VPKDEIQEGRIGADPRLDYLIRIGLGSSEKIVWWRQVYGDPHKAVMTPFLRPYAAEAIERLIGLVMSDPQLYQRVRTLLQRKRVVPAAGFFEEWELSEEAIAERTVENIKKVAREA